MTKIRFIGAAVLIIILSILLAWVVTSNQEGFIYKNIIQPLSFAFWIISLLLRGTPQAVFWGIMLFVVFLLALRSLSGQQKKPFRPIVDDSGYARHARLRFWVRQLILSRDEHARFQLDEAVGRLAVDVLAYRQRITSSQFQRRYNLDEIEPEFLQPFLKARSRPRLTTLTFAFSDFLRWLERVISALASRGDSKPAAREDLEQVVEFLEQQMDIG